MPLIIFCHGVGEGGAATNLWNNGLPLALKQGFRPPYPCVIIAPQASGGWVPASWMPQLIKECYRLYKTDTTATTITGLSAGGSTVWESALNINQDFAKKIAALVPLSAYPSNCNRANMPWFKQSKIPVWAIAGGGTGGNETFFMQGNVELVNLVNAQVPNLAKMSIRAGVGHEKFVDVYNFLS